MGTYASASDVVTRLPNRRISASSSPSTTEIGAWIDEAEARLHGALRAGGLPTTGFGAEAILALKGIVVDYAEGRTRQAFAQTAGDDSQDGRQLLADFKEALDSISHEGEKWAEILDVAVLSTQTGFKSLAKSKQPTRVFTREEQF